MFYDRNLTDEYYELNEHGLAKVCALDENRKWLEQPGTWALPSATNCEQC